VAKDTYNVYASKQKSVGGLDESVEMTDRSPVFQSIGGVFPFFYGNHQRMFGKKLIDYNPAQKIFGIHQSFNGVCLYGYYVETDQKLYFHVCSAPPDLRIRFATLQHE
jgi:hypothetical protein